MNRPVIQGSAELGQTAYETRFLVRGLRAEADEWSMLPNSVKQGWARVEAACVARFAPVEEWRPIEECLHDTRKIIGWCVFGAGFQMGEARECQRYVYRGEAHAWMAHGCSQRVTHFKPWLEDAPPPPAEPSRSDIGSPKGRLGKPATEMTLRSERRNLVRPLRPRSDIADEGEG